MLAVGQAAKVLLANLAVQAPLGRELTVPFTVDPIANGVVVVARILELFRVIAVRLAGAQGSGDRQHALYMRALFSRFRAVRRSGKTGQRRRRSSRAAWGPVST